MCPSVRICPGHNSYIHGWISKLFDAGVLEEEKCRLKQFLGRLKGSVTLECHINYLFRAVTPIFMIFMHGFKNTFAQVFSLRSSSAI